MRVKGYPHSALILTLIAESTMNKGIQANYEGMRVKSTKTFFREYHFIRILSTKSFLLIFSSSKEVTRLSFNVMFSNKIFSTFRFLS